MDIQAKIVYQKDKIIFIDLWSIWFLLINIFNILKFYLVTYREVYVMCAKMMLIEIWLTSSSHTGIIFLLHCTVALLLAEDIIW